MNKNQLISAIKSLIKEKSDNKTYYFGEDCFASLWCNDEQTMTKLHKVFIKKDVLYITITDWLGTDDEKVSVFDTDEIEMFYNKIKNNE